MSRARTLSRLRRRAYRGASMAGDLQAWSSGSPTKIVKRYTRKAMYRQSSRLIRRILR